MPAKYRAIHPVFHASKLATYTEPTYPAQQFERTEPPDPSKPDEWIVEKILQHEKRGKKMFYLIRWKGFDRSEDTWEPEANLKGTQALQDYKKSL